MSLGRAITHHHVGVEELDSAYEITALDKPEPLSKCYRVNTVDSEPGHTSIGTFSIQFQDGGPEKVGHNGLTDEVLLAILIDRANHAEQGREIEKHLTEAMLCMRHAILEQHEKRN